MNREMFFTVIKRGTVCLYRVIDSFCLKPKIKAEIE